jgi:hypothetical protein
MALGGLTSFVTCEPTPHFQSNCEVIAAFTGTRVRAEARGSGRYEVKRALL